MVSTCGSRVLLGYSDIVRFASDGAADHIVVLRCSCGDLVRWDRQPPPSTRLEARGEIGLSCPR